MTRPQLWALSLLKAVREFYSFIVASWLGSTAGLQHVSWWCVVLCGLREGDVCMAGGSGGHAETLKQSGQGPVAAHICFQFGTNWLKGGPALPRGITGL